MIKYFAVFFVLFNIFACNSCSKSETSTLPEKDIETPQEAPSFYYGADLSYVNEMLDCGAVYKGATETAEESPLMAQRWLLYSTEGYSC